MENTEEKKKSNRAQEEENILRFWQDKNIFEKSLEKDSPKGEFVFYDGPPTANGKPGIHHLEPSCFKDAIPRYKTMRGYHVRRKRGWDTHGLPVELQVEKELGLKSKKEVEAYGVAAFNKKCKESVWQYLDVWEKFTSRIGFWIDKKNPYVTYHNSYIESLWNVVGKVNERGLLYKDYKVVPWCPRCGTALSSHELAQGYMDVKDLSVYAKFKLVPGQKWGTDFETKDSAYILAWTTTPWTLPGNVALAVGKDIVYTALRIEGVAELYIVAKALIETVFKDQKIEIVHDDILGSMLIGLEYVPLYPYLKDAIANDEAYTDSRDKAFKVYGADFVTTTDGTGVVHTAVMYGQDDFELGTKLGLPKFHTVDVAGNFVSGTEFLQGRFVKDDEVAIDIIKDLAHRGLLFKKEKYEHSYPHCWRCKTPLIYYARDSWYIRMSELRDELVNENKSINWEPAYIRDGRFGEWLKDIKDWAISRERYWGTPLPIWEKQNGERVVVDSIGTLRKYAKKSGNEYFVMRHGKTLSNEKYVWDFEGNPENHLTSEGKDQVIHSTQNCIEKFDMIVHSPLLRTTETASLFAQEVGFTGSMVVDDRLREFNPGKQYQWKPLSDFFPFFKTYKERYTKVNPDGENYADLKKRVMDVVTEYEEKYQNKKILFVSHGGPILNIILGARGVLHDNIGENIEVLEYPKNAEIRKIDYVPFPHNEHYELDLHKPYIDEVELVDEEGNKMTRVKEVMDVWFDSGCMPFAQDHYPFEGTEVAYPADFICEAIDQTRGWFYTLHAVGTLLGRGKAYKNVICLGHILDAQGKKMSKSLGNIVDPWDMMEKYGVDPLRFWMYTVNQPGEPKNFDEKTVLDISRKVFTLLENVVTFYELYRDTTLETNNVPTSTNVLDTWILAKQNALIQDMTENLDNYKLLEPGRALREFIDDLSTWYLRRSRERLKEVNTDDSADAKKTLYFVLKTLSKLFAPLAPFMAESLYQKLRMESDPESVHLENWPTFSDIDEDTIDHMDFIRGLVSQALELRQQNGIPVRQPLASLQLNNGLPVGTQHIEQYKNLIKEEINVKVVEEHASIAQNILLDLNITPELKAEGDMREFIRAVQDMRKQKGLQPSDEINLTLEVEKIGQDLLMKFEKEILEKVGGVTRIHFGTGTRGEPVVIDGIKFIVSF